jgi:hypothetical protein
MSQENILNERVAKSFLENSFSVDLSSYTEITEDAAEIFGKTYSHPALGQEIKLTSLNKLSEACAEKLSHFKGYRLNIKAKRLSDKAIEILSHNLLSELSLGIANISENAGKSLKQFKGPALDLEISELSVSVASALAEYKGCLSLVQQKELSDDDFCDVQQRRSRMLRKWTLSDECADKLSNFQGETLSIYDTPETFFMPPLDKPLKRELSEKVIRNLSKIVKSNLILGIEKISEEGANLLKNFRGPNLSLGLLELSSVCAKAFAQLECGLCLNKLKEISDEVAKMLACYSGPDLQLGHPFCKISNAGLISLANVQGNLTLPFMPKISDEVISAFIKRKVVDESGQSLDPVVRNVNANISPKNVDKIVKQHSRIDLELREISDEAAEILSKNQGKLVLSGLKKISDNCASILAKHKGELYLRKDVEITAQGMETLKKHNGSLFFKEYGDFLYGKI